jgi:hypothetical protein
MLSKQKDGRSFTTMVKDLKYGPIEQDSSLAIQRLVLGNPQQKNEMNILSFVIKDR